MNPIKLGIIGCGVIGSMHVEMATKSPYIDLLAVADLIPERVNAKADKYNVPRRYSSGAALLEDPDIEAVVLAMPVIDRTPLAFATLEKGKHLIIEKPIAASVPDVQKMLALRGDRVVSLCSSRMTQTSHARAAAQVVASGALGQIRIVRFRAVGSASSNPAPFGPPPPWRQSFRLNGGGILVNWSCYDLDYLMYITNWQLRPRTVLAQWWPVGAKMTAAVAPGSDADSHFTAFVQCDDRIVLSMERAEFAALQTDCAWEVIGTEGTLHLPMVLQANKPNAVILDRFVPGQGIVTETIPQEPHADQALGFLEDFYHAVREGAQPRTTLERALLMQQLTDAIYTSAKTGQAVTIQ